MSKKTKDKAVFAFILSAERFSAITADIAAGTNGVQARKLEALAYVNDCMGKYGELDAAGNPQNPSMDFLENAFAEISFMPHHFTASLADWCKAQVMKHSVAQPQSKKGQVKDAVILKKKRKNFKGFDVNLQTLAEWYKASVEKVEKVHAKRKPAEFDATKYATQVNVKCDENAGLQGVIAATWEDDVLMDILESRGYTITAAKLKAA